MNADMNIARQLRSLSIDRVESGPIDPATPQRFPIRTVASAGAVAFIAGAYLTHVPFVDRLLKPLAVNMLSEPASSSPARQQLVDAQPPPPAPRQQAVIGSGYVMAERMITLRPEIGGKVTYLPLDVGDHFVAGQVIADLDTATDEIQLKVAQSQAATAAAALGRIEVSLEHARRTLERSRLLVARGALAVSSLDTDSLAVTQLTSDLDVARQTAETARLQVEMQKRILSLHQIVAPFDGVVVARLVAQGDTVASGTDGGGPRDGIAVLLDPNSLTIDVDVAQSNAGHIVPGQPAIGVLDAFPDQRFEMRVRTIVPAASLQKGTLTVRLEFLVPPQRVLPNMAAKVTFDTREDQADMQKRGS